MTPRLVLPLLALLVGFPGDKRTDRCEREHARCTERCRSEPAPLLRFCEENCDRGLGRCRRDGKPQPLG